MLTHPIFTLTFLGEDTSSQHTAPGGSKTNTTTSLRVSFSNGGRFTWGITLVDKPEFF